MIKSEFYKGNGRYSDLETEIYDAELRKWGELVLQNVFWEFWRISAASCDLEFCQFENFSEFSAGGWAYQK